MIDHQQKGNNIMKNIKALSLLAILLTSGQVFANEDINQNKEKERISLKIKADKMHERLSSDLNLTEEQDGKVKQIMAEQRKLRFEAMQENRKQTEEKLKNVLTDEQMNKLKKIKQEKRDSKRPSHHDH